MSAPITFTAFVDPAILWPSLTEANAFFSSLTVRDASLVNAGVVKQAALPAATSDLAAMAYDSFVIDGVTYHVITEASVILIAAKIAALTTALNTLLTEMKNAGQGT